MLSTSGTLVQLLPLCWWLIKEIIERRGNECSSTTTTMLPKGIQTMNPSIGHMV